MASQNSVGEDAPKDETELQAFYRHVYKRDTETVIARLEAPTDALYEQLTSNPSMMKRLLSTAAGLGYDVLVDKLLDRGVSPNMSHDERRLSFSPLAAAISKGQLHTAAKLLASGAEPGVDRVLLLAIKCQDKVLRVQLIELLLEHGADVNEVFDTYGNRDLLFTALEHTSDKEVRKYLRSIGAKTVAELRAEGKLPEAEAPQPKRLLPPERLREEVIEFFANQFGPVNQKSLVELVPEEFPVVIHMIPPTEFRETTILFTTGLSQKPMTLPEDFPAAADYQYGELYIELPADWKFDALEDPKLNWPVKSLRWLAKFPHLTGGWLGYPVAVVDNGEPPTALAPNFAADGLLLFADENFKSSAGHLVHLYRVMPIFAEERKLEKRKGYEALLQALDKAGVKHSVDIQRKPAVK